MLLEKILEKYLEKTKTTKTKKEFAEINYVLSFVSLEKVKMLVENGDSVAFNSAYSGDLPVKWTKYIAPIITEYQEQLIKLSHKNESQVILPGDKVRLVHPREVLKKYELNPNDEIVFEDVNLPLEKYEEIFHLPSLPIVSSITKNDDFSLEGVSEVFGNETAFDVIISSQKINTKSEDNKSFQKEMTIIDRKDRILLSFGEPYTFEIDVFMDDVKEGSLPDVCIDGGGRNHGTSSVWANGAEVLKFIQEFLEKYDLKPEKGLNREKYLSLYIENNLNSLTPREDMYLEPFSENEISIKK